jgi:hypothetical protein
VLDFGHLGNIGELFPSCEPVSFIPTLGFACVYKPKIPNPRVSFLASGPPPTRFPRTRVQSTPFLYPLLPFMSSLSNMQPGHAGTGARGETRVAFFIRVVRASGHGEAWGGGGVAVGKKKHCLPSGKIKTFYRGLKWHGAAPQRRLTRDRQEDALLCMDLESKEEVRDAYLRRTRSISPTGLFHLKLFPTRDAGQPRNGPSKGQGEWRENTEPNIITPPKREITPSFNALETAAADSCTVTTIRSSGIIQ